MALYTIFIIYRIEIPLAIKQTFKEICIILFIPLISIFFQSIYVDILLLVFCIMKLKLIRINKLFRLILYILLVYLYIYSIELLLNLIFLSLIDLDIFLIKLISYIISQVLFIVGICLFKKTELDLLDIKFKNVSLFVLIQTVVIISILVILNAGIELLIKNNYSSSTLNLLIIIIIISILIIVIGVCFYGIIMYNYQIRNNLFLKNEYIDMQNVYLDTLKTYDREYMEFRHDIKNHLSTLKILMNENEIDKAIVYLEQIETGFMEIKKVFKTGNDLADIIINQKYISAKEKGIEFLVKGILPEHINISIYSFSTILFNLLDNAIEANEKSKLEKYIHLEFGYYRDYLNIKISNPGSNIDINKSSKDNKRVHGFGISNIRKELSRNNGNMRIENENSQFTIDIILKYK